VDYVNRIRSVEFVTQRLINLKIELGRSVSWAIIMRVIG